MKRSSVSAAAVVAGFMALVVGMAGWAQTQTRQREQVQERKRDRLGQREIIPGSELMTAREREAYRRRMAGAASDADRDRIRARHVKAMQERARLRGLNLSDPVAAPEGAKR